jgi:hypothetical protein
VRICLTAEPECLEVDAQDWVRSNLSRMSRGPRAPQKELGLASARTPWDGSQRQGVEQP